MNKLTLLELDHLRNRGIPRQRLCMFGISSLF